MPQKQLKARTDHRLHRDVRAGVLSGLYFGGFFAAVALIGLALDAERMEQRMHGSVWSAVIWYLACGAVIGAVAGACKPWLRSRAAYLIFGFLVAVPASAAGAAIFLGIDYLRTGEGWVLAIFIALLLGPMAANTLWRERG